MKQNITWEQFTELTYEQVAKLQILINQKYHRVMNAEHWEEIKNFKIVSSTGEVFRVHTSYLGFLNKTNIGKMIEILEGAGVNWYYWIFDADYDGDINKRYDGEICDALWKEVKRIL